MAAINKSVRTGANNCIAIRLDNEKPYRPQSRDAATFGKILVMNGLCYTLGRAAISVSIAPMYSRRIYISENDLCSVTIYAGDCCGEIRAFMEVKTAYNAEYRYELNEFSILAHVAMSGSGNEDGDADGEAGIFAAFTNLYPLVGSLLFSEVVKGCPNLSHAKLSFDKVEDKPSNVVSASTDDPTVAEAQ